MYTVILSPKFEEAYKKLQPQIRDRVKKILKKLETRLCGDALKGDLLGFYSVHFERNKYRLIYYKDNNRIEVLVIHVGKRTDHFYEEFKKEYIRTQRKTNTLTK